MEQNYLLALDGGTGSFRAVLFDYSGNQIAMSQKEWTHSADPKYPGSIDFDWNNAWKTIINCIKDLKTKHGINLNKITAISASSMREGFVLLDENKKELLAFSNIDARSSKEAIQLKNELPELEKEAYIQTGQSFALSAIPRLLWVKNNKKDLYKHTKHICMINDWISFKLTGNITSEPSNASTTGLLSLATGDWNQDLIKELDFPSHIFPPILRIGDTIGYVSQEVADITGLSTGTAVVVGGGDAQVGTIGVGATKINQAVLFGGSFWQYEVNLDKSNLTSNDTIRLNCHVLKDSWQAESIAWNPGLAMRWFRDSFLQYEMEEARNKGMSVYALMDEKIKDIPPGSNGMFALFSNKMNFLNLRHASPTFTNFSLDPILFNKYTFYKSIMESAGFVSYAHILELDKLNPDTSKEIIFAGGSAYSDTWCQIISDITGRIIKVPIEKEATSLGTALIAGVGIGIYPNIEDVNKYIQTEKVFHPNPDNHNSYLQMYEQWKVIYQKQLELADQKITNHMWIAPGV